MVCLTSCFTEGGLKPWNLCSKYKIKVRLEIKPHLSTYLWQTGASAHTIKLLFEAVLT